MSYLEDLFGLSGKVAVVTGAARGNGKAIASALSQAGATTILCDRDADGLSLALSQLSKKASSNVFSFIGDLAEAHTIPELSEFISESVGSVDILVNNAGVTHSCSVWEYPKEFIDATYQVNFKAPLELSMEMGKLMRSTRGGSIINITSLSAEVAFPDNVAYGAFKAALKQLSKTLALEFAPHGIRVNCIGPGYIRTEMTKVSWADQEKRTNRSSRTMLGRWGVPDDLAGGVVFLASDASSYITGQDIYIDGGWLAKGL